MKIIRPGLKDNEIIYDCTKCKCQFLFSTDEMIGMQPQGGYIKCPECEEMHFIYMHQHIGIKGVKDERKRK